MWFLNYRHIHQCIEALAHIHIEFNEELFISLHNFNERTSRTERKVFFLTFFYINLSVMGIAGIANNSNSSSNYEFPCK